MANVLIVYGSTTGNTGYVAETVGRGLTEKGATVTLLDAGDAQAEGLCNGQDMILFGCSTWGDDDIELQDDFVPLLEQFDSIGAEGKKVAVFGCGDSSYTHFCGAVDEIERTLNDLNAHIIAGSLKIDGDPHGEKDALDDWTEEVAKAL